MAARKRSIIEEHSAAGSMIPYYESLGDHRTVKILQFHQSQIALEMARRYQERTCISQRETTAVYAAMAPDFSDNDALHQRIDRIRRAQRKVVLYASKTPDSKAPSAALFWVRQGRTDVRVEKTLDSKHRLTLCASSLILQKQLSHQADGWAVGRRNAIQAVLHSGVVANTTPPQPEDSFVADNRQTELIVGAQDIETWSQDGQTDETFGTIAARLARHISSSGISNAEPK